MRSMVGFGIGPLVSAAFGLVTVPAVAWAFTPEDIGRLNIVNIAISFTVIVFTLGLDQAYVREFYETPNRAGLLKSCFGPGFILLVVAAIPCAVFPHKLSTWLYGSPNPLFAWLTIACIFGAFVSRYLSLILRMQERGLAFSMSQIVPKALFVLLIGYLMVSRIPRHFLQLLIILLVSTTAVLITYAWNTRREWIPALRASVDRDQLRLLIKFGLPVNLGGVAYGGLAATSALALRSMSSFHELGVYSVTMSVAAVATIFQSIFTVIWIPVVYKWVADGVDLTRVDRVASQVLALVCGVFVVCGLFSWLVDYVLPNQYHEVKYLVLCGIAQPLLYTLSEVTCIGIGITRRTIFSLWSTLAALASNVGLSLLLVPPLGASGAVVANALAFLVFFVARSESSAYVWRRLPQVKLYLFVTGVVGLSVLTVLVGPTTGNFYAWFWVVASPIVIWSFRHEERALVSHFRKRMRANNAM